MTNSQGLVLIAYDGSELAAFAIEQAAEQLGQGRDALVVCVWQPADVGFIPTDSHHFDADRADEVREAAAATAAHGASLAEKAGFKAESFALMSAPTWQGVIKTAEDRGATLIVMGSHRHTGLMGHLLGSVAHAVVAHAAAPVLVVHQIK